LLRTSSPRAWWLTIYWLGGPQNSHHSPQSLVWSVLVMGFAMKDRDVRHLWLSTIQNDSWLPASNQDFAVATHRSQPHTRIQLFAATLPESENVKLLWVPLKWKNMLPSLLYCTGQNVVSIMVDFRVAARCPCSCGTFFSVAFQ
jgi:hypothetical protein